MAATMTSYPRCIQRLVHFVRQMPHSQGKSDAAAAADAARLAVSAEIAAAAAREQKEGWLDGRSDAAAAAEAARRANATVDDGAGEKAEDDLKEEEVRRLIDRIDHVCWHWQILHARAVIRLCGWS